MGSRPSLNFNLEANLDDLSGRDSEIRRRQVRVEVLFGPAGDLARLPQGDSSIGRESTKRAMGDSVVASDEASYETG